MKFILLDCFIIFTLVILFDGCKSDELSELISELSDLSLKVRRVPSAWYDDAYNQLYVDISNIAGKEYAEKVEAAKTINQLIIKEPLLSDKHIPDTFNQADDKIWLAIAKVGLFHEFLWFLSGTDEDLDKFGNHKEDVNEAFAKFLNFCNSIKSGNNEDFIHFVENMKESAMKDGWAECIKMKEKKLTRITTENIVDFYSTLKTSVERSTSSKRVKTRLIKKLTVIKDALLTELEKKKNLQHFEEHFKIALFHAGIIEYIISKYYNAIVGTYSFHKNSK